MVFDTWSNTFWLFFSSVVFWAHPSVIKHGHGISSPRRLVIPAASPFSNAQEREVFPRRAAAFHPAGWELGRRCGEWMQSAGIWWLPIIHIYIYIPHIIWTVYIYIHTYVYIDTVCRMCPYELLCVLHLNSYTYVYICIYVHVFI